MRSTENDYQTLLTVSNHVLSGFSMSRLKLQCLSYQVFTRSHTGKCVQQRVSKGKTHAQNQPLKGKMYTVNVKEQSYQNGQHIKIQDKYHFCCDDNFTLMRYSLNVFLNVIELSKSLCTKDTAQHTLNALFKMPL